MAYFNKSRGVQGSRIVVLKKQQRCYNYDMKTDVIYLLGMFEDEQNPLFLDIQSRLQRHQKSCTPIKLFENRAFGSYSFFKEIQRVKDILEKQVPSLLIAHSLGAYVALCARPTTPLILLDPSLCIAEIILSNTNKTIYSDGTYSFKLSKEFLESIKKCPAISEACQRIHDGKDISIYGAGKGGFRIAQNYHKLISHSYYTYLPDANHNFSNEGAQKIIWEEIKKWLDTTVSSQEVTVTH